MNLISYPLHLLVIVVFITGATATETLVNNAFACNGKQNPKGELQCRKSRAANLYCSDRTMCSIDTLSTQVHVHPGTGTPIDALYCPEDQAARRIGMTCNGSPFYNGGYPILTHFYWDREWEDYDCLESSNGFCTEWSSHEDSPDEYELSIYTCEETNRTAEGAPYCSSWSSTQVETKKCDKLSYDCRPNCAQPTFCYRTCCSDSGCYDCSYTPWSEREFSIAHCIEVNDQGACLVWKQEEYDEHNYHFREYETYTCLELSLSKRYCRRWVGEIDSEEEFEISTCLCLEDDTQNKTHCLQWTCNEAGLSYYFPNYCWILLPVMICLCFWLCCLFEPSTISVLFYLLLFVGLTIAAAFLAGFVAVMVSTSICLVLFPLSFFIGKHYLKERRWRERRSQTQYFNHYH